MTINDGAATGERLVFLHLDRRRRYDGSWSLIDSGCRNGESASCPALDRGMLSQSFVVCIFLFLKSMAFRELCNMTRGGV